MRLQLSNQHLFSLAAHNADASRPSANFVITFVPGAPPPLPLFHGATAQKTKQRSRDKMAAELFIAASEERLQRRPSCCNAT